MPLTEKQLKDLKNVAKQLPSLSLNTKSGIVTEVVGLDKAKTNPWATIATTIADNEFIDSMIRELQSTKNDKLIARFLELIKECSLNDDDGALLTQLIQNLAASSTNSVATVTPRNTAMKSKPAPGLHYIDFDIYLSSSTGSDGQKEISATLHGKSSTGEHISLPQAVRVDSLAHLQAPTASNPSERELADYGHKIFEALFLQGKMGVNWGIAITGKTDLIRIGISSDDRELLEIHWELLCDQPDLNSFLAWDSKYSVSRIISPNYPAEYPELNAPLRILIGHASPMGTSAISKDIALAFKRLAEEGGHSAKLVEQINFDALQTALQGQRDRNFHVIHLVCHGIFKDDIGKLAFEDESGNKQYIDAPVLAEVLKSCKPALVILQACFSGEINSRTDWVSGVGETLLRTGVPCVLAFRGGPQTDYATKFIEEVYKRWLNGDSTFEGAVRSAHLKIRDSLTHSPQDRKNDAWALPVVLRHKGVFLEINRPTVTPDPPTIKDLWISCSGLANAISNLPVFLNKQIAEKNPEIRIDHIPNALNAIRMGLPNLAILLSKNDYLDAQDSLEELQVRYDRYIDWLNKGYQRTATLDEINKYFTEELDGWIGKSFLPTMERVCSKRTDNLD